MHPARSIIVPALASIVVVGALIATDRRAAASQKPSESGAPRPAEQLSDREFGARAFTVDRGRILATAVVAFLTAGGVAATAWYTGRDRQWRRQRIAALPPYSGDTEERIPPFDEAIIAPEYTPPDGMRPGLLGALLHEGVRPLDLSVTLIDLATRGYMHVEEIEDAWGSTGDWLLTRRKGPTGLTRYEAAVFAALFKEGTRVSHSNIRKRLHTLQRQMGREVEREMIDRGWYSAGPSGTRQQWAEFSGWLVALAVAVEILAIGASDFAIVPLPLVAGAIVLFLLFGQMPARTAAGTAMHRRVLGFRRFILEAESRRAQFAHDAAVFYEYLPYAMVFGATASWAHAFESPLRTADWLQSHRVANAFELVDVMGRFADATTTRFPNR